MNAVHAHGAAEWEQAISTGFVPLRLGRVADGFHGSLTQTGLLPGVTVTTVRTRGDSEVLRTPRLAGSAPRDDLLFSLHLSGTGTVRQRGRETRLEPGTGAVYDAAVPYSLHFPASSREIVLQLPRRMLSERFDRVDEACGRPLSTRQPATRVLAAFLRGLVAAMPRLDAESRADLAWSSAELLVTALRAAAGEPRPVPEGRRALLEAMRVHVRERCADPRLTPEVLARRHSVSVRHVTALFAEAGTSPAAFIREQRLNRAHRALTDPRQAHRTIAAIAAGAGFADRTTFTRAFVRRYGATPAELRAR
ncbi:MULTISPECIES: helix-turn-helix domain-containing protein [unclassified Nocardiopsis]|uniref:AraC-like ligand-binding domain-containing protein n=1 Tax=unclassified Nocardiopsis TaxID=2649073 RepID=UPI00135AB98C|nr:MULTISPECIES: helix-turn-helix domain-containing protein [unclassified Nocardiopsis]